MTKKSSLADNQLLVSSIYTTEWIDLSDNHNSLREYLEQNIYNSCVDKSNVSPVMVKGAFGIGKTAVLNYLFHYGWTKLNIPVFHVELTDIVSVLKQYNDENDLEKTPNEEVGQIIQEFLENQIDLLKEKDFVDIHGGNISFPSFKDEKANLNDYLSRFKPASLNNSNAKTTDLKKFSPEIITETLKSHHRYLLLIDEFEAKFHELRNIIEDSGGGKIRQLFDDIANCSVNYYCIIANGPASGYELSRDNKKELSNSSSDAAEQRRIYVKQIFTPTVKSLSESFLHGYDKRHINFYWWVSRSRPGLIKNLKDSLQSLEELQDNGYNDFISNNKILKNDVDDMGESNVPLFKKELITNLESTKLQNKIKDLLIQLGPHEMDLRDDPWIELLSENKKLFYVSEKLTDKDDIVDVLRKDAVKLLKKEKKETVEEETLQEYLQKYLHLILNSISDEKGKIAFGMIKKGDKPETAVKIFLSPVLKMIDDFLSIYEDDTDYKIKLLLDFVRTLIRKSEPEDYDDIEELFENTYELFLENSVKLKKDTKKTYIQLSLYTLQETIEQPIGSPRLSYKNDNLEDKISSIDSFDNIFIYQQDDNNEIIFFPAFSNEALLKSYDETLTNYFRKNWYEGKNYDGNGKLVTSVVYFEQNDVIDDFKNWLQNDKDDKQELCAFLNKVTCVNIDKYELNNSNSISDFINSLCKIATVGIKAEELAIEELNKSGEDSKNIILIDKLIKKINDPDWTEQKKIRRIIEYYKNLLLSGENSAFNLIIEKNNAKYKNTVNKKFPALKDLHKLSKIIGLDDVSSFYIVPGNINKADKNFISLFFADQHKISNEVITVLSDLKKLQLFPEDNEELSLISLHNFLNHYETKKISMFSKEYSNDDKQFRSFRKYIKLFAKYSEIDDMESFITELNEENLVVDSYLDYLNYDENKKYFLHGVYFSELLKTIETESYQKELLENIEEKKTKLSTLTNELTELFKSTKELIGSKKDFFEQNKLIEYTTKLLIPCQKLINVSDNKSDLIIGYYIVENFETVIDKIQNFKSQLQNIYSSLNDYKEKIDEKQDIVDKIYDENNLTGILYKVEYSKGISNDYFYNSIFRPSFKQSGESFDDIFGKKYNPTDKQCSIDEKKIEEFQNTLKESYEKKEEDINQKIEELQNIKSQVDEVEKLETYIEELINIDIKE